MRTRTALTATAWVAGAALATAGATVALSVLGSDLLGTSAPVLSSAQVQAQLAAPGRAGPATAPRPSSQPAASPGAGAARIFSGGTVYAVCAHHQATLADWVPAQGYETAGFSAGPARAVAVRFQSASAVLVVTVTCPRNRPAFLPSSATPPAPPAGAGTAPPATAPPADQGQRGGGPGPGRGGGRGGRGGDG
jgi:hypothetical protein